MSMGQIIVDNNKTFDDFEQKTLSQTFDNAIVLSFVKFTQNQRHLFSIDFPNVQWTFRFLNLCDLFSICV